MFSFVTQFFVYSFLGFLLEAAYARLLSQPGQGKKCLLLLPLCPVYGLGAAAILHMPGLLLRYPLAVFIAGGLLATLVEYSVGLFYRVAVGVAFWDYSRQPGNIAGLICPLYTLFWGLLALALVYWVDPLLAPLLASAPTWLVPTLFLVFSVDALISLWLLHQSGSKESLRWYQNFPSPKKLSM